MIHKEQIQSLIDDFLSERKDLFLMDCTVSSNNHIQVIIDGDKGVCIQDCLDLSRKIEFTLDREVEDFSLDVKSYGLDSPLVLPRQFAKHQNKKIKILRDDKQIEGQLLEVSEEGIVLQTKERKKKKIGKGKETVIEEHTIPLSTITKAELIIQI